MQFSTLLLPAAFTLAAAQYGSSDTSSTTSSAAPAIFTSDSGVVTHKIAVGKSGLTFSPDTITAAVGDALEFHFYPNTHSVAQSSFAAPCAPLNSSSLFSGPFTTSSGVNETVYTVIVNSTSSIWLYCGFKGHCQKGMTAVVNPPSDTAKTLDLYKKAANLTTNTTVPSKAQGGIKGAAALSASGTGTAASASASSTSKPNDAPAMSATLGVFAGVLSLAFAGLIM